MPKVFANSDYKEISVTDTSGILRTFDSENGNVEYKIGSGQWIDSGSHKINILLQPMTVGMGVPSTYLKELLLIHG